jgi:putative ABC transport system ATP-binding protein
METDWSFLPQPARRPTLNSPQPRPHTTTPPMSLIVLDDVWKVYDLGEVQVEALRGAALSIAQGEYAALIGPSGSGKSTLMNVVGCLDRPTRGSYDLAGEEVGSLSRDARAQIRNRRIGFVFQNFNLLARTSALENVEMPLLYSHGISSRERHQRARSLLEQVGLDDRMHHHPGQLSGGQQQRVAVARSLVNEPDILLADEPTGNLDSRTAKEVIELFRKLNEERGITVILVTHDRDVAANARRIITLKDGEIVEDTGGGCQNPKSEV